MKKDINSMFSLDKKTAIITGASRGIGEEIAGVFAKAGARVVVCSRKQETVVQGAEAIVQQGGQALACADNIAEEKDLENLIKKTMEWGGSIDVLVNSAGANPQFGGLEDLMLF